MKLDSLRDLLIEQLHDVYDAEQQITEALPKMAEAASSSELQQAFNQHLEQTQEHVQRLEQVFEKLGEEPQRETCKGMKGLIAEGEELIQKGRDPDTLDAGLVAAAQRVEHYEIAAYGTARTYARTLGEEEIAELLQTTLDEEGETDEKLTRLAEQSINVEAARG